MITILQWTYFSTVTHFRLPNCFRQLRGYWIIAELSEVVIFAFSTSLSEKAMQMRWRNTEQRQQCSYQWVTLPSWPYNADFFATIGEETHVLSLYCPHPNTRSDTNTVAQPAFCRMRGAKFPDSHSYNSDKNAIRSAENKVHSGQICIRFFYALLGGTWPKNAGKRLRHAKSQQIIRGARSEPYSHNRCVLRSQMNEA